MENHKLYSATLSVSVKLSFKRCPRVYSQQRLTLCTRNIILFVHSPSA